MPRDLSGASAWSRCVFSCAIIATGASTRQENRAGMACDWMMPRLLDRIFDITKVRGGAKLKFTQIGIPPGRYSGHYRGWIETYWTPLKEIFAIGTINDKTRGRVKVDLEQRITGKFRRKIR
jgi:hypothetical protein